MEIEQDESVDTYLNDIVLLISFTKAHNNTLLEYIRGANQDGGDTPAVVDDEIGFPLQPNGELNFHRVKLWWGVHLCAALEPYSWKVFKPRDPKTISGIAVQNLTSGAPTKVNLTLVVEPTEGDEYKREEQGTWAHELKWQRRAYTDDPTWYPDRLVALCALFWLLSLVPGALSALQFAVCILIYTLAVVSHWTHELKLVAAAAHWQMPVYTPLPWARM